jgi:Flp pilus assembly protein TadD
MANWPVKWVAVLFASAVLYTPCVLAAGTITITVPRHSSLTVVQRLNREGVKAVEGHDYQKAEELFLKAYLYDPADPYTLNNLGYISELHGQLDRAERFYKLAAEQGSNASIDLSNVAQLQGKPMQDAFLSLEQVPMRVNRMNVNAMQMLSAGRGSEAAEILKQALKLAPQDPFTLNNLGVAEEAMGDYGEALNDYRAASDSRSQETAVVTLNGAWRGKPVSAMAAANARRLEEQMQGANSAAMQARTLTVRGVAAENENDWPAAQRDFLDAYSLDPSNAFALNNRGYVAEREGDLESAEFFYRKARFGTGADLPVGLATNRSSEGKMLSGVSADSQQKVNGALEEYSQQRREETAPVELTPRGGGLPSKPPATLEKQPTPNTDGVPLPPATPQNEN